MGGKRTLKKVIYGRVTVFAYLLELVVEFALHAQLIDLDGFMRFQRRSLFVA